MNAVRCLLPLVLLFASAFSALADSCLSGGCHQAIDDLRYRHQPVTEGDCLSCHLATGETHPADGRQGFTLAAQGADLCNRCHSLPTGMKKVHLPVAEGECLSCHRPHGSAGRFLLDDSDDLGPLCFSCHDRAPFQLPTAHGPVAAGACTACHSPHASELDFLLLAKGQESCLKCHDDFARQMQEAAVIHPPVRKSPCTSCHSPHSSATVALLTGEMPELCLGCHAQIGKIVAEAKNQHPPLRSENGCGSCHNSHFSRSAGLLPLDEQSLCLNCHGEDQQGSSSRRNIQKEISGAKVLHGPLNEKKCSPCHNPHGSDHPRLLSGAFPDSLYFPYQSGGYDFCLDCHDRNLLRFKETTIYTEFRNGDLNLHFLHVADKRKGRSCRFCHATHASDAPKLISKKGVAFGEWDIPIRLELSPSGGSCAPGCHAPLAYDRLAPVDYGKSGKKHIKETSR